jgi:anti-sigma B factor antagonist
MAACRFRVRGEVDIATAAAVRRKLMVLAAVTADDVVIDCTDLEFVDSSGIGVFAYFQRVLAVEGRELRLINMSDRVRRPFDILGLTEALGIEMLDPA